MMDINIQYYKNLPKCCKVLLFSFDKSINTFTINTTKIDYVTSVTKRLCTTSIKHLSYIKGYKLLNYNGIMLIGPARHVYIYANMEDGFQVFGHMHHKLYVNGAATSCNET